MADPIPPKKIVVTDPSLSDLLNEFGRSIKIETNCHAIATVQSFNSLKQTIRATMTYTQLFYETQSNGISAPVLKSYPILVDCPVVILGGGNAHLTMPISPGDDCLICFNDRDLDNWHAGKSGGSTATGRLHSFADGIAIVGLNSLAKSIANYDTTRAKLFWKGGASVGVGAHKVKIENQIESLNAILQDLVSAIAGLVTLNTIPGSPTTLNPATISALNAIAARLGALLE